MNKKIDLHIHTTFSDGTLTPYETVKDAKLKELSAISITDHDEIGGVKPAIEAGKEFSVKIVTGIELSAQYKEKSIHILGYFINPDSPLLIDFLKNMRSARFKRAIRIVEKLQEKGIPITLKDVRKHTGQGGIGRLHIASALLELGIVQNYHSAFSKYLGDGKSCYVSKGNITSETVIKLIRDIKGVPVLAHPNLSNINSNIEELVDNGLLGIEVWYPGHSDNTIKEYLKIIKKYNLVATGGSDSHGTRKDYSSIGDFTVEHNVLDTLEHFYNSINTD